MSEFKTDKAVYTSHDFLLWLVRRNVRTHTEVSTSAVWKTPARSFFIDTILRGMTVPPIYLRMIQNATKSKAIREVVDGQQRVRCVVDFFNGTYDYSRTLNAPWSGRLFQQLSSAEQDLIKDFGFTAEIFKGISDQQVLEVFCRLNMNGIPLNKQELRNGKFFGLFKQTSLEMAFEYLEFWRTNGLFTEQSIARMLEVELTANC